jgi:hypothetical protein
MLDFDKFCFLLNLSLVNKDKENITYEFFLDGFLIRQSAKLGFRVLPTRRQLDEVIFHGRKAELYDQYKTFIKTIKQIYDTVERYYAEMKYLQLP